jgi:hypothetical protein
MKGKTNVNRTVRISVNLNRLEYVDLAVCSGYASQKETEFIREAIKRHCDYIVGVKNAKESS